MKNLNLLSKILSVFLLLFAIFAFSQTAIKVTYYTGSTQDYTIETTGKLYFSGSNLLVKTNGTANNVSIPTNIIRKITFTTSSLATQEIGQNKSKFRLYPNPASDFVKISSDKKQKMNVKIYSSTGSLVLKGTFQPDEEININSLTSGFYLVQVDETTLKMIKK
ncbi:T9SS type A sorting domain-containing protein [Chryseobacterium sp. PBS4-4]|uniref:T9SS type A sorting domain-containing protein n=1 Tax=Chryseobacterium edaphi TaxID=2976532 RepID=A0ABT2W8Q7_9FLAO|nr:T9SS type A sorting domain-containing protein [Chryseobacterium edaphi]MCU7618375.1 T9SS type A sorting domain-containing protein [Chryseobacterium edaphi]